MYCMSLNKLGAFVSTTHLKVKFLLEDGLVSTISINQEIARKSLVEELKETEIAEGKKVKVSMTLTPQLE
ncbi:hypothetical protein JHK86_009881 [Glycine max]|nr:hypothetical protein JHK86_009881 [Glycine max]